MRFSSRTRSLALTGVLCAFVCAATMVIQIPSPTHGYVNLGDAMVLLSAMLLGPWYGAAAAGIGSALADLISGYAIYIPATLLLKALAAVLQGLLFRLRPKSTQAIVLSGFTAEIPIILGYWLYEALLLHSLKAAALGIPGNLVQAIAGIAVSAVILTLLRKIPAVRKALGDE